MARRRSRPFWLKQWQKKTDTAAKKTSDMTTMGITIQVVGVDEPPESLSCVRWLLEREVVALAVGGGVGAGVRVDRVGGASLQQAFSFPTGI